VSDLRGLLGLAAILAVAFLVSNNRGRIRWRTVVVGLAIQVAFAALVLRWSVGRDVKNLSHQTVVVVTFALAGFANFASIAIQIGSIGGLAPERRGDVAQLGLKALLAGSLVSLASRLSPASWPPEAGSASGHRGVTGTRSHLNTYVMSN
jgi:nucleoside permease NupC